MNTLIRNTIKPFYNAMYVRIRKAQNSVSVLGRRPLINAVYFPLFFVLAVFPAFAGDGVIHMPVVGSGSRIEGWKVREWKGRAEIEAVDTEVGQAIHLKSESTSTALYREGSIDIKTYPYVNWKWMVKKLPKGGDVRNKKADDQAVQFYVIFPYKWPAAFNSRLVGYVWDTSAPVGAELTSAKTPLTKYIVLESGETGLGKWRAEERNVYEDYKRLFKEEPPMPSGISVMIDSDDTKSSAESFVADIYFAGKGARK